MNKLRLFLENFIVYGIGGVLSKVIHLIMIPIVLRLMPSSDYYGISDLSNTIVSFASAFAVMGMYDAMYRMFFDKEEEKFKRVVCSTTLIFNVCTSMIVFAFLIIFKDYIALAFFKNRDYAYVVYISAMATLVGATNSIVAAPTRMQNKKKEYLIINTIGPFISYAISVPLLLHGYYIVALPIAGVLSGTITEILFYCLNHKWFDIHFFDINLLKEMLVFALPIVPSFLAYWIFNSSDRVMISNMLDLNAVGIYSVAAKIGMCSQLIYTAFAGGWQYFAFATMNDNNQVENNSKIFEYLGIISFSATAILCAISYWLFKILFPSQYIDGYIIAPYLFLAPLLQMLYQVIANQFSVIKKTWPTLFILSTGAVANVLFNFKLIPILGIEGAAIGTVLGYTVSDIICTVVLLRMKLMVISKEFIAAVILMVLYFVVWRFYFSTYIIVGIVATGVLVLLFAYMYRVEILFIYKRIKR